MEDITDIYRSKTVDDLYDAGQKLLDKHHDKRIFAICGKLGSGKTNFIKIVCRLLGVEETVTSPSYSIIYEYRTKKGIPVYHFDLYRLNVDQVFDLGYEEYLFSGNYCFIEWADKIYHLLPDDTVIVKIEDVNGERIIKF